MTIGGNAIVRATGEGVTEQEPQEGGGEESTKVEKMSHNRIYVTHTHTHTHTYTRTHVDIQVKGRAEKS